MFDIKINLNKEKKIEIYTLLEQELSSDDYEYESLLSDLCVELGKSNVVKILLDIDKEEIKKPVDPTLAYLLVELPYIIKEIKSGNALDYVLSLNPEFDSSELIFIASSDDDDVLLKYSANSGNEIVETNVTKIELCESVHDFVAKFSSIIMNLSGEIYEHRLFQEWLRSEDEDI